MPKKTKSAKRGKSRERRERRFEPRASVPPFVAYLLGAVGALAMGAGAWGQFGASLEGSVLEPLRAAPYILAAGAVLVGAAIWVGTSGDPPLRVGDGGIGVEKGGVRRMPWYAVDRVEWRGEAVRVNGKDDTGLAMNIIAKLTAQPQAGAWIVKEARSRVPSTVDVPADATLPEALPGAGEVVTLDPLQVVGKHCAASGKVISYEPDARLCARCERTYHKAHVPAACACGAPLDVLRDEI
jgi:hypothetical protein